jgi:hypothetical protein
MRGSVSVRATLSRGTIPQEYDNRKVSKKNNTKQW